MEAMAEASGQGGKQQGIQQWIRGRHATARSQPTGGQQTDYDEMVTNGGMYTHTDTIYTHA
jgi:hypothetical protein